MTKYIRHKDYGFFVWPASFPMYHAHFAKFVGREGIVSAGFVRKTDDGKLQCYGESESLGIASALEDSEDLSDQLEGA